MKLWPEEALQPSSKMINSLILKTFLEVSRWHCIILYFPKRKVETISEVPQWMNYRAGTVPGSLTTLLVLMKNFNNVWPVVCKQPLSPASQWILYSSFKGWATCFLKVSATASSTHLIAISSPSRRQWGLGSSQGPPDSSHNPLPLFTSHNPSATPSTQDFIDNPPKTLPAASTLSLKCR